MNTIYSRFRHQVRVHGDEAAVIHRGRTMSYRQLDEAVIDFSASMPQLCGGCVGIVMNHGPLMVTAILSVLKTGAAYVPVEPSFPADRIAFIMRECGVDYIITDKANAPRLGDFPLFVADGQHTVTQACNNRMSGIRPDDLAYVLYTSGSTGMPKGVMVTNANVCHYADAFHHEFNNRPGDVMLQYSVCTFDIFIEEMFTTLLWGAALAIPTPAEKRDMRSLMDFVRRNHVTIISGFPYLLLDMDKEADSLPPTVRLLISGGDVLRARYVRHLLPKTLVYNTYGPSETTVCAAYFRCTADNADADGTFPIGKPVLGSGIVIMDDNLKPVPAGQVGEICILGDGVSAGYIGERPVENMAFVTLDDGRRLYRSGDMGFLGVDGQLRFLHRKDSQVMIMGRRVEVAEVQNVLSQCPGVDKSVVIARNDKQGLAYLTAYVTGAGDHALDADRLRCHMAAFLPDYMIPEFFVQLGSMPLTANGKVDTAALPVVLPASKISYEDDCETARQFGR